MNIILKASLLVASTAMLSACVEDDTYYSTQVSHTHAYYTNVRPSSRTVYYDRGHERQRSHGVVVVNPQQSVESPRYSGGFSATVAPAAPPEHTYQPQAHVAPAPQPVNPGYSARVAPEAPVDNTFSANVAPAAPAPAAPAPAPVASGNSATVAPAAPAEVTAEAPPEKKAEEAAPAPVASGNGVSAVVAPAAPPE